MKNFDYRLPTRFVFGKAAEKQVGALLKQAGATRVLLVCGNSAIRSGLLDAIKRDLAEYDISSVVLSGVSANPTDDRVDEGIALVKGEKVDYLLAVGGGSAIDCCKAIAHGSLYEGDFRDFFNGKAKVERTMPFSVVLTTSAAGSESSDSCVITQKATMLKRGLSTPFNRPEIAFMNPELAMSCSPYQMAAGATDILAHIMERYFTSETEVDLTDRLCEATMQAVIRAARIAVKQPENYDAQAQLMWAGTIAHNGTLGVGRQSDFGSHQIEHELSALYGVAHGAGLAVVFPAWMRYHLPNHTMRLAQFANRVYNIPFNFEQPMETALRGIEAHESFLKEIGMPLTLRELGAKGEDIPFLAAKTKRNPQTLLTGNAWPIDEQAVAEILRIADR